MFFTEGVSVAQGEKLKEKEEKEREREGLQHEREKEDTKDQKEKKSDLSVCTGTPLVRSLKEKEKMKDDDIQQLQRRDEDRPTSVSTCSSSRHLAKRKKDAAPSRQDVLLEIRTQWAQAVAEKRVPTTRYGYVKREESFELFIFGRGLDALDKVEYQSSVSSIHFMYLTIDLVIQRLPRLLKFPNLREVTLAHNLIHDTSQLHMFQQIPNVVNLHILANPACADALFRMRVINMLPNIEMLNGYPVTKEEKERIQRVLGPLEEAEREMTPWKAVDSAPSSAIVMAVDDLLGHALSVEEKVAQVRNFFDDTMGNEFRRIWDNDIVQE